MYTVNNNLIFREVSISKFEILTLNIGFPLWVHPVLCFLSLDDSILLSINNDYNLWTCTIFSRNKEWVFKINFQSQFSYELDSCLYDLIKKLPSYRYLKFYEKKEANLYRRHKDTLSFQYKLLNDDQRFIAPKELIKEILYGYYDKDGIFVKEFQGAGFNKRLWELFLYCYFKEEKFAFNEGYASPDFLISKGDHEIAVEATSVNFPDADSSFEEKLGLHQLVAPNQRNFNKKKLKNSLKKKLKYKYWSLPHINTVTPFILAIQSFLDLSDPFAIMECLYGLNIEWEKSQKKIIFNNNQKIVEYCWELNSEKGFFNLPNSENVSAVLFSNSGHIGKFNRMGKLSEFDNNNLNLFLAGSYITSNIKSKMPIFINYTQLRMNHKESWGLGLFMYHNPYAINKIKQILFPNICHGFIRGNKFILQTPFELTPLWLFQYEVLK